MSSSAGVFAFALPKIADYGDVWDVVKGLSWQWIVALLLAVLLNTATYGPPLDGRAAGLSYLHATRMSLASTACRWSRRAAPPSEWRRRSRC